MCSVEALATEAATTYRRLHGLPMASTFTPRPNPNRAPVTKADVLEVQKNWAGAIKSISKVYKEGGDYVAAALAAAGELYAYGHSEVLFKPTKAAQNQFR